MGFRPNEARGALHVARVGCFLSHGHQSLGPAKADERMDIEEIPDHAVEIGSDLLCSFEQRAMDRAGVEGMLDARREVVEIGVAIMPGDHLLLDELLLMEYLQDAFCGTNPDLSADVGMGHRIGLVLELEVVIRMDTGKLPLRDFKGPVR